ncbi:putative glutathione S-transferase parA [Canna indica]|uniref:Glutathione S-transferase parA n=1 Tax=Canna indica TaxID=4628 RepID=A0AAQ3JMC3_9LILI|nr:putative glutathione S-transferase parA [Canna indica]
MFFAALSLASRIIRRYRIRRRCRPAAVPRSGSWRRPPKALLERSRSVSLVMQRCLEAVHGGIPCPLPLSLSHGQGSLEPISHFLWLKDSEEKVVGLSSEMLLAASNFVYEVGNELRRDQNLQIHHRGHNLPWSFSAKKIYECGTRLWKLKGEAQQEAKKEFVEILKLFDRELGDKKYFGGETFGFVDIALIPFSSGFYTYETCAGLSVDAEAPKLVLLYVLYYLLCYINLLLCTTRLHSAFFLE